MFGSLQLDGITADNSGNLYIVDAAPVGKIYKLTISDLSQEVLVPSGLPTYPQDIHYDETNNRLLLASYDTNAPILGIDPDDGMLTSLIITTHGNMDGVAIDNDNYIYVSCNSEGAIYRYEPTFIDPPVKVSTGHSGPAGIGYNPVDNILAIPNYFGDTVDFILLDDTDEDNILDYWDNCPEIPNTDQADADSDNRGDLCDGCPENYNPGGEDIDIDGIEDACDNCPDHPNPGQEDINDNGVGDLCDYICGDIDGTPGINILDIVFLVNNVYKAGPDPDPMESGDVNHDYLVNILDIVLLVNNVYKGGIDPECVVWI
ncbi:MAG: hypothetical protein GY865_00210 [candidate division Zixibacteria bacterium]|nr:hypothetical protein [candidate division Zixibacteria bacterium]